jgi:hypothetical protein
VYEHWRPDTGEIFYVGKGKGRRAFELKWGRTLKRNPNHYQEAAMHAARAVVCQNDGERYQTMTDAARAYGLAKGRVFDVCSGRTKNTKNGLMFSYAAVP